MTARAREVFDKYVAACLNHPDLHGLSIGSHVFNLNAAALDAGVSASELIEEVGPLSQALMAAKKKA